VARGESLPESRKPIGRRVSIIINALTWPPLMFFFAAGLYHAHYKNNVDQDVFSPFIESYIDEIQNTSQKAASTRIAGPMVVIREDEESIYSPAFEIIPANLVAHKPEEVRVIVMVSYIGIKKAFVYDKFYRDGHRMAAFYHAWSIKIVDRTSHSILLETEQGFKPPSSVPETDIDWYGVKRKKHLQFIKLRGEPGVIWKNNSPPNKEALRDNIVRLCGFSDWWLLWPFQFRFGFEG